MLTPINIEADDRGSATANIDNSSTVALQDDAIFLDGNNNRIQLSDSGAIAAGAETSRLAIETSIRAAETLGREASTIASDGLAAGRDVAQLAGDLSFRAIQDAGAARDSAQQLALDTSALNAQVSRDSIQASSEASRLVAAQSGVFIDEAARLAENNSQLAQFAINDSATARTQVIDASLSFADQNRLLSEFAIADSAASRDQVARISSDAINVNAALSRDVIGAVTDANNNVLNFANSSTQQVIDANRDFAALNAGVSSDAIRFAGETNQNVIDLATDQRADTFNFSSGVINGVTNTVTSLANSAVSNSQSLIDTFSNLAGEALRVTQDGFTAAIAENGRLVNSALSTGEQIQRTPEENIAISQGQSDTRTIQAIAAVGAAVLIGAVLLRGK